MSDSESERLLSPSKWSKRFDSIQLELHYYNFVKQVTEDVRKTIKHKLDVPYGTTERTKYDVYGTDLPKDSPIFVFIHGGYWQESSKDLATVPVPVFVRNGIKVITVGYDLCPNVKIGDIITEIKMAVENILQFALNLGCRNVWVAGHSAGAHLAVSLLYDKQWLDEMKKQEYLHLLKGVVLISGVYNLTPLVDTSYNTALKLTKDEIETYSFNAPDVKIGVHIDRLKTIVVVGECDSPWFIGQSRECAQKLLTVVDNIQYILLRENVDHFDIVEKLMDEEFILTKTILNSVFN
ncbi:kynurenine formamidase [Ceratina calcarata]|uniref:Kynurenine formamidase n=1 Tax=Ceratina calcarata TaxID=156304 RepID=A0AAJ7SED1_9HYME|nr:kynurenine formamidase [Ceratina calcarata]